MYTRLTARGKKFYFNSLAWRNIVTHGQLKENLYFYLQNSVVIETQERICKVITVRQ